MLKKPLYHGTAMARLKGIREKGLLIGYSHNHPETDDPRDSRGRKVKRSFKRGVFLTDDFDSAVYYAFDATKNIDPDELEDNPSIVDYAEEEPEEAAIVIVKGVPDKAKIGKDGFGDVMVNQDIPPEYLEFLDSKQLAHRLGYKTIVGYLIKDKNEKLKATRKDTSPRSITGNAPSLSDVAKFYPRLHERNKGRFFRGTSGGKGQGFGALGAGLYLSWDKKMAAAFGKDVAVYELPKDLKLLDAQSKTMFDFKATMGFKPWEYSGDPMYARALKMMAEQKGYDGVISDELAEGIVVFDEKKVKVLHKKRKYYERTRGK
jgi:hypothetical protein